MGILVVFLVGFWWGALAKNTDFRHKARKLEKATGVKGYDGIKDLSFNGTHNGMARSLDKKVANGMKGMRSSRCESNGAPFSGCYGSNGVAAR